LPKPEDEPDWLYIGDAGKVIILNHQNKKRTRAPKEQRSNADFSHILIQIKLVALELATTIVFFVWLYRILMHEVGR
jgi:hypothetical protein